MLLYHVHMWPSYPEEKPYIVLGRRPLHPDPLDKFHALARGAAALGRAPVSINPRRARLGCPEQSLLLALIYVPRRQGSGEGQSAKQTDRSGRRQGLVDQVCLSVCL